MFKKSLLWIFFFFCSFNVATEAASVSIEENPSKESTEKYEEFQKKGGLLKGLSAQVNYLALAGEKSGFQITGLGYSFGVAMPFYYWPQMAPGNFLSRFGLYVSFAFAGQETAISGSGSGTDFKLHQVNLVVPVRIGLAFQAVTFTAGSMLSLLGTGLSLYLSYSPEYQLSMYTSQTEITSGSQSGLLTYSTGSESKLNKGALALELLFSSVVHVPQRPVLKLDFYFIAGDINVAGMGAGVLLYY